MNDEIINMNDEYADESFTPSAATFPPIPHQVKVHCANPFIQQTTANTQTVTSAISTTWDINEQAQTLGRGNKSRGYRLAVQYCFKMGVEL